MRSGRIAEGLADTSVDAAIEQYGSSVSSVKFNVLRTL